MTGKVTSSRLKAYECLELIRKRDAFADEVIGKIIDSSSMKPSDRAFSTRLVLGVVACSGSLDFLINRTVENPKNIKPKLRSALRISAYEIIYLDKSPYASVDQGVELVKRVQPKAKGLANFILHRISESKPDFPFGNPSSNLKAYSLLHAFPEWLCAKLIEELGTKRAHEFVTASNEPAPIFISISCLNRKSAEILASLNRNEIDITPVEIGDIAIDRCYRLSDPKDISKPALIDLIERGDVLVSDASAQSISLLAVQALHRVSADICAPSVLELCAGRGTKSILLQNAIMAAFGQQSDYFVSVDNIQYKTRLLKERAQKYGAELFNSICSDVQDVSKALDVSEYDLVFLDSPCTGLGTLRRHPEIRWRLTPEVIEESAKLDMDLIKHASKHVASNGLLVYSTCTVTKEEDELVIERFLNSQEGSCFKLLPINGLPVFRTYLAANGYDAHFAAFLIREDIK